MQVSVLRMLSHHHGFQEDDCGRIQCIGEEWTGMEYDNSDTIQSLALLLQNCDSKGQTLFQNIRTDNIADVWEGQRTRWMMRSRWLMVRAQWEGRYFLSRRDANNKTLLCWSTFRVFCTLLCILSKGDLKPRRLNMIIILFVQVKDLGNLCDDDNGKGAEIQTCLFISGLALCSLSYAYCADSIGGI